MNIEEIVEYFRKYATIREYAMITDIEDYITNLKKEKEALKEELQQEKKDFEEVNDYCFELKDYKSRNEKAIEYINNSCYTPEFQKFYLDNLLNILQGEDKE